MILHVIRNQNTQRDTELKEAAMVSTVSSQGWNKINSQFRTVRQTHQNWRNLPVWDERSTSIGERRWWSRSNHWKLGGRGGRRKGVPRTNDLLTDLDGAACDARFRTRVLTHARMHDRRDRYRATYASSRRMSSRSMVSRRRVDRAPIVPRDTS